MSVQASIPNEAINMSKTVSVLFIYDNKNVKSSIFCLLR